ncbi:MAG: TldD/PmbA family protein [Geminicoccaceae bacterium]
MTSFADLPSPLERAGLDPDSARRVVADAVTGCDDGELFVEIRESEALSFDDGRLKSTSFDAASGFGLRAIVGEAIGYAHSSAFSEASLSRAAKAVQQVRRGRSGTAALGPHGSNARLYSDINPIGTQPMSAKVATLQAIDAYARERDVRVRQVSINLAGSWQAVEILRADGLRVRDLRPLVRLNVQVVLAQGERMESGSYGFGGRVGYDGLIEASAWQHAVGKAIRQAEVKLDSVPAPAGEMTVVLGPGWPGILLHEAIGHGLEGDFNRKKTSAFSGLMGKRIAAPGITVVDDGTIADRRGSLTVDDEGTASTCTTLIEDGVLIGYMQDRQNGRLMGTVSTGNGRRQSYAHVPMPRMTNTYMLAGDHEPAALFEGIERGVYGVNFGGGQVDITSGKFVFTMSEAYRIENGKITAPLKGATLIGDGADALTKISAVANDMKLDNGIGTCGKEGQWVPVGVGQPSLRIDGLTVGGTAKPA